MKPSGFTNPPMELARKFPKGLPSSLKSNRIVHPASENIPSIVSGTGFPIVLSIAAKNKSPAAPPTLVASNEWQLKSLTGSTSVTVKSAKGKNTAGVEGAFGFKFCKLAGSANAGVTPTTRISDIVTAKNL